MKAIWNDQILAESDNTIVVEGNHYFPANAVKKEYFRDSPTRSLCPWKGNATYFHLEVEGKTNSDAAWAYPEPSEAAGKIKDYVAFWKGVEITD